MGGGGGAARLEPISGLAGSTFNLLFHFSTSLLFHLWSQSNVQAVKAHRQSCLDDGRALGRLFQQDGIRIVDVRVHPMLARQPGELFETAVATCNRQMAHPTRRSGADAKVHWLLIGPERSVEEQHISLGQASKD